MQTFEQKYKEKLKAQLAQFIPGKSVVVSNDISYEPLEYDENALIAIIKTGAGSTSGKREYDLITTTFNITLITKSNDLQQVLGAITSLIWNYQGVWDDVKLNIYNIITTQLEEKTYIFKPVFTTPIPLNGEQEVRIEGETLEVSTILMGVTVGYSSNVDMRPDDFQLEINGTKYKINATRYDYSSVPSFEPVPIGGYFSKQTFVGDSVSFNFTMLKSLPGVDALQDILVLEFFGSTRLSGKTLKLYRGTAVVDIQTYQLTEAYENGTKVINLVLNR